MSVSQFYADEHLGMAYGRIHSGQDVNKWAPGTLIPSPVAGKVAKKGKSLRYGFWVAVKQPDGTYVGAAHMLTDSPLKVGATVAVNTTLGLLGNTGSYSRGAHTHIYHSTVPEPWGRPTSDPLPIINQAVMEEIMGNNIVFVKEGTTWHWYVYGVGWKSSTNQTTATLLRDVIGDQPAITVTATQLTQLFACFPEPASSSGGLTDEQVVDDAELGQALTATVSLVNAQATVNKDEILTAINSLTLSAG